MPKLRLPITGVLAGALFFSACTPLNIQQIQAFTVQICGFLPTAVAIANFFPNPINVPAEAVAQAICAAVVTQVPPAGRRRSARLGASAPLDVTVKAGGTTFVVTGYFVR